jgi:hypothetical protein
MPKLELESKLEDRCVAKIEARGGLGLKLVLLGVRGFLDRTMLAPGRVIFFCEFKRQKVGVVSAQQAVWRRILTLLGFGVYMIDSDADFDRALERELGR